MKRTLLITTFLAAAAFLFASVKPADAGVRISIGGYGHRHHHHGYYHSHRGLFTHHHGLFGRSFYRPYRSYSFYSYYPRTYGYYSSPFIYRSYVPSYYGGYGCASNTYTYPGVVAVPAAPLYADSSRAYGPEAVKDFFGLNRGYAADAERPQPLVVDLKPEAGKGVLDADEVEERFVSNEEARARATRFVSFGDDKFGEQEYHSAAQRYRFAIEAAPDIADAHFKQGFAYIASNRYELAVKSFKRGLQVDPLWINSSFRIDDLYGRNALAKGSHVDALAKSALIDRGNADHFFLLGVLLHFDGQPERAKKFFERAVKLTGDDAEHIGAFLAPPLPNAEDAI